LIAIIPEYLQRAYTFVIADPKLRQNGRFENVAMFGFSSDGSSSQ
jgi:hypothetical protein